MLDRMTHYFAALVFLIASAVIYENVLTPWMEPAKLSSVPPKKPFDGSVGGDKLADLFPDPEAWQRGACKQLQTSDGMLLFANGKQISANQWKLWPVTIVVGRGMSSESKRDPLIIEAPEGAEIIFTTSLDVMSSAGAGAKTPIKRGRMIGRVNIRRPSSDKPTQAIEITTANVGIDRRKIWTTERIEMKFGDARLSGRDLTVHYSGPDASGGGNPASILDRMDLIYLDQFIMPLKEGGLLKSKKRPGDRSTPIPGPSAVISLNCGGRVEYDFAIDQLSLRDSVSLVHQVDGMPADQFHCDSLLLNLLDPTNDKLPRETPLDWIKRIVATGRPARAVLPTFDSEMQADSIDFDAEAGLVRAIGKSGIWVRRGGIEASLAQLAYQFDPNNYEAIGLINVQGAGIIKVNDPKIPLLRAHWRDRFRLEPTKASVADEFDADVVLQIDGDIQATLSDGGQFHAQTVDGLLKPKYEFDPKKQKKVMSLVPKTFQAQGNVRVDTSAIAAETDRLDLEFVQPIDPQPRSVSGDDKAAEDKKKSNPLRQWVIQPEKGADNKVDPVARPRPVIRGDWISAQLRLDEDAVNAKDMSVTGSVSLTHVLKTGDKMLPARLTGESLRLIDGGGEDLLQLGSGVESPARFELGDGFFVGPMIQIRPTDNLVWINAAGEFQMPTAALPTSLTGDKESEFVWVRAPHCRWQGEMFFDGRSAVLTDGVRIDASLRREADLWDVEMHGDRLQVDLQSGVQVNDVDTMKNAAIERISLMQSEERPVLVQAFRRAGDNVLEAKHVMKADKLVLVPGSKGGGGVISGGRLIGEGPGWYRGWMKPKSKGAFGKLIGGGDKEGQVAKKLNGVHLIFHNTMQGDLVTKSLEFVRGVRVGLRGLDDWDQSFDAATMDSISAGDATIDCDKLRFAISPGQRSPSTGDQAWEMEANSGVVFRTRSERGLLEGTASRAAYASAKDLFTIEGAPNRAATFKHTLADGKPGPEGAVRSMTIQTATQEVKSLQLERINIATPPTLSPR